jgi:hypothetical protein
MVRVIVPERSSWRSPTKRRSIFNVCSGRLCRYDNDE